MYMQTNSHTQPSASLKSYYEKHNKGIQKIEYRYIIINSFPHWFCRNASTIFKQFITLEEIY